MRGGIRARITAIAVIAATIVLVATGIALLISQQRILTNNLDELLSTHSADIERSYASANLIDPIIGQGDEDAIAQVVGADGHVIASTANFAGEPPLPAPNAGRTEFRTTRLAIDHSNYRLMSRSVGDIVIHTGTPIDDVEESVRALRTGLIIAIPAADLLLGALIWWLVGRTLRPVETIRAEVADITGANLNRRVPEPAKNDEIARLARTMNAMLDRVEDASDRQHRFVADASHELRSPLTRIRTELEVDLDHPETADHVATHRSVLEEVGNLQRLVDDLLHLARADSGARAATTQKFRPVDLDDLVLSEAQRLRANGRVRIDTSQVSAAQVLGEAEQLARAIRNLSDNALRHAATTVAFATHEDNGVARLSVTDDGAGIPEPERSRVFERFARLDESRRVASGGTGLGLAIALDIVQRHGGTITIETPGAGGTTCVVSLPSIDAT